MCQLKENMENDEQIIYMITTSFIYKEEYNTTNNNPEKTLEKDIL